MSQSRSKKKKAFSGNHQRSWVWGRNLVMEILEGDWWGIEECYFDEKIPDEEKEGLKLKVFNKPFTFSPDVKINWVSRERITQLCNQKNHQGFLLRMGEFSYVSFKATAIEREPTFVVLDRIQDSYNFGAIIRSAEFFGIGAIVIGMKEQSEVNSLVARSSVGAVARMRICRSHNLKEDIERIKEVLNYKVYAANEKNGIESNQVNFPKKSIIIIGNEGNGVSKDLIEICDEEIRIPQVGQMGSLNAAMAASILFYETSRQKK